MANSVLYINEDEFQREVLASELPVVLDFYSEDCPPCEQLAPMFERLAERYGAHLKFCKIFRQQNRPLAERLGVRSSPTLLFFRAGQEVGARLSGFIRKPDLRQAIEKVLDLKEGDRQLGIVQSDLIILGAGVAGLSAAIYAGRAKVNTTVLDESAPGGQVASTYHIANYPGTGGVVRGRELVANMRAQATHFGARLDDFKEVSEVDLRGSPKRVRTEDTVYEAPTLIIATGSEPRKLPAEGEEEFRGRGVHYCATCDGAMYEGKRVVVVGGGNSAVEEAVFLTRYAQHVTIVHEFAEFQASAGAQEEALSHLSIGVIWRSHVDAVSGEGFVSGITLRNLDTGEVSRLATDAVFVYIGLQPRTSLFQGQLSLDEYGYVIADEELRTGIEGVFAAGDVRRKSVRQAVTAAADGAIAGVNVQKYLSSRRSATVARG